MDIKQKATLYRSVILLAVAGIGFLVKGFLSKQATLLIIGIILLLMGGIRWILIKNILHTEHEDD